MLKGSAMHYRAISNRGGHFEVSREQFTLVCLKILKRGNPVGNQRIRGLFYYNIYLNNLCLSSTSDDVIFPLKPGRKFVTTLLFLVANK